eukprot:2367313-Rhodomonas_salina.3
MESRLRHVHWRSGNPRHSPTEEVRVLLSSYSPSRYCPRYLLLAVRYWPGAAGNAAMGASSADKGYAATRRYGGSVLPHDGR